MNYFSMQRAFYDCVAMAELSAGQIALWQALLNVCNRAGWPVWFFARSEMLAVLSGLSQRGMRNAREQLVGKGFLQVREAGHNRQEYRVCLPQRKTREAAKTEEQCTPDFAAPPCIPYSQDKTKTRESGAGPAKQVVLTQAKEADDADRLHSGGRKAKDAGARGVESAEEWQGEAQGEGNAQSPGGLPRERKEGQEPCAQNMREVERAEKVQREAQKEGAQGAREVQSAEERQGEAQGGGNAQSPGGLPRERKEGQEPCAQNMRGVESAEEWQGEAQGEGAQGAPGQKAEAGREKANGKSVPEKEQRACAPGRMKEKEPAAREPAAQEPAAQKRQRPKDVFCGAERGEKEGPAFGSAAAKAQGGGERERGKEPAGKGEGEAQSPGGLPRERKERQSAEEPRAQGARERESAEEWQREAHKEGEEGAPGQKAEAGRKKANGKAVPEKEKRACAPGAGEVTRAAVAYLSQKTGRRFSPTAGCQTLVARRMAEGYREEDFKRVVDVKCAEWKQSEKMAKFLRPETLFGPKFQSYRNQAALRGEKEERDERPLRGVRRI